MASDLISGYDENLMDNAFFQTLQKEFSELFLKAISEGCVICVPRSGSLPRYLLTLETFLSHILVQSEELPETHFQNLNGVKITISNGIITVDHEVGRQSSTYILFQETFYTKDSIKYEVLCVEQPFEGNIDSFQYNGGVTVLKSLRDCLGLLWTETGTHETIELIDREIAAFLTKNDNIDTNNLQIIKDSVGSLYIKCIQILMKNSNIKEKAKTQKYIMNNLKIAVETYMQQGIYKKIMKGITTCTAYDDAQFNKIVRNFSDLNFKDLNIKTEFHISIPIARLELSRISGYSTTLGKVGCLKRAVTALSDLPKEKVILNTEDLLQILAFLIIKTNLPNWNAQVKFLKLFQFSNTSYFDEDNFLITSLEAAIIYVQSGILSGSSAPEGQNEIGSVENSVKGELPLIKQINDKASTSEKTIGHFFHQITLGNLEEVKKIIETDQSYVNDYSSLNLCHPLCACEKCSFAICKTCETAPTVKSCDDQGLTALHIASMYGVPNIVEYLLAQEADPNASDCDGKTPVHYAALRGHQNALLLLIHNDADINVQDNSSNTPLHLCANNGHESCVKALIYFSEYLGIKLKINQQNIRGDTALHNAAKWGYINIVNILLEYGADPTLMNKSKFSPIDYAHNVKVSQLMKKNCKSINKYIRIKPLNPVFDLEEQTNEKPKEHLFKDVQPNSTELMRKVTKVLKAIENGDINLVCFYMDIDMSEFTEVSNSLDPPESKPLDKEEKCHPLCICAKCGGADVENNQEQNRSKFSKKKSLSINICDSDGWTALHMASKHGNLDLVKVLIKNGALLDVQASSHLYTPLMLACQNQELKIVKVLLESGCKIDMQDCKLNTALHHACATGNPKLVEMLLKCEPNVNLKNMENKTALQLARENPAIGMIQILKGKSAQKVKEIKNEDA